MTSIPPLENSSERPKFTVDYSTYVVVISGRFLNKKKLCERCSYTVCTDVKYE
jgi:hypothetical protein